jgi:hypothetical protein
LFLLFIDILLFCVQKNTIRTVFQAVSDSVVLDKASQKVMSNLITVCSVPGGEETHEEGYL